MSVARQLDHSDTGLDNLIDTAQRQMTKMKETEINGQFERETCLDLAAGCLEVALARTADPTLILRIKWELELNKAFLNNR
jgi:hypothetical protein